VGGGATAGELCVCCDCWRAVCVFVMRVLTGMFVWMSSRTACSPQPAFASLLCCCWPALPPLLFVCLPMVPLCSGSMGTPTHRESHPNTACALTDLAAVQREQSKFEEAETNAQRAVASLRRGVGAKDVSTATALCVFFRKPCPGQSCPFSWSP
jgi:hypothetical protein